MLMEHPSAVSLSGKRLLRIPVTIFEGDSNATFVAQHATVHIFLHPYTL